MIPKSSIHCISPKPTNKRDCLTKNKNTCLPFSRRTFLPTKEKPLFATMPTVVTLGKFISSSRHIRSNPPKRLLNRQDFSNTSSAHPLTTAHGKEWPKVSSYTGLLSRIRPTRLRQLLARNSHSANIASSCSQRRHNLTLDSNLSVTTHIPQPVALFTTMIFSPVNNFDKDDDIFFDINSDITTLQAYKSNFSSKRPFTPFQPGSRLSGDQWHRLSLEAKEVWDQLPQEAKAIILEAQQNNPASNARPPTPSLSHVHDMTVSDLHANLHDLCTGRDDDPPDHDGTTDHGDRHNNEFQDANQEEESPILAHLTKRKEFPLEIYVAFS